MTTYTTQNISPADILPPHEVRDEAKLAGIIASMQIDGWCGRPLLLLEKEDESGTEYQAATGSHRHAAALQIEMEVVPALVVTQSEIAAAGYRLEWDGYTYLLRDREGSIVNEEYGYLDFLSLLNRADAVALLQEEIEQNA